MEDSRAVDRAWWQSVSLGEFKSRMAGMTIQALEILVIEITGTIKVIREQLVGDGIAEVDGDWKHRARMALAFTTQKNTALRSEIARRQNNSREIKANRKAGLMARARAALQAGQTAETLALVLDLLDATYSKPDPALAPE